MDLPPNPPSEPAPPASCAACGGFLKPENRFCPACGHKRGDPGPSLPAPALSPRDVALRTAVGLRDIRFAVLFYVFLLGSQGATALIGHLSGSGFAAILAGTALMSTCTLLATARRSGLVGPLYARAGFGPVGFLLIAVASVPIYLGVHLFVEAFTALFRIRQPGGLEDLAGRPLAWAFLLVVAAPAFIEELGFRGLVFGLLRRRLPLAEAFLISSFAFGALHLSIPSLLTHVPLGLYLCWLRHRSGSLYPAMLAHALHNSWWVLVERLGFLS